MNILGISALYHDSAAALCVNSEIIAAAQEERFTRIKGDSSFPANSIKYCLSKMNGKLDAVAFYDNPILTLDRFLHNLKGNEQSDVILKKETYKVFGERLTICKTIREFLHNLKVNDDYKIYVCKHHISHAASAFYPSPFEKAAFLINDGVGEWATTTLGVGEQTKLTVLKELLYPDSLGLLYSTFTAFCGFKVNFGEYKLMGLAPYGSPKWVKQILENIVDLKDDGSFKLNPSYFKYREYQQMYSDEFAKLFGIAPRTPESKIDIAYMDIAASIQEVTNLIILKQAKYLRDITNCKNLVLKLIFMVYRESKPILLSQIPFNQYVTLKQVKGLQFDEDCISETWIHPSVDDYKYLRSYQNVAITNRRTIEIRSDCQQPFNRLIYPAVFNFGLKQAVNEVSSYLNNINFNFFQLRDDVVQNGFDTKIVESKKWLTGISINILYIIKEKYRSRGFGEEKYVDVLINQMIEEINPAIEYLSIKNKKEYFMAEWRDFLKSK